MQHLGAANESVLMHHFHDSGLTLERHEASHIVRGIMGRVVKAKDFAKVC